jgi:23S rRNA pseudouridine2604 synthase
MCEYFGYRVEKLVRVRIMNIELGDLQPGAYRNVTGIEYEKLLQLISRSSNLPASQAKQEKGDKKHGKFTANARAGRPLK